MNRKGKHIRFTFFCTLLLLGITSCKQELPIDALQQYQVYFNLENVSTRATGNESQTNSKEADDREKQVTSLYTVVFEKEEGLFFNTFKCEAVGAGKYTFDMQRAGSFNCYFVANPSEDLIAKLMAGPITVEEFGKLVANQLPGEDNSATNFLMTSKKISVDMVKQTKKDVGTIALERVAARFDFYNEIQNLKLNSITFKNRYVQSRIAPSIKMDGLENTSDKSYELTAENKKCIATIYSYENSNRGETIFVLEGTYNGNSIKPYEVVLENMPIKRNTLYTIKIKQKEEVNQLDPNNIASSAIVEVVTKKIQ